MQDADRTVGMEPQVKPLMSNHTVNVAQPAFLLFLPLLIPQMMWVRKRTPRLKEATGVVGRIPGAQPEARLVLVGDSMAAGVGVADHGASLAGQLAERLASRLDRAFSWQVIARTGATTRSTIRALEQTPNALGPADTAPDLVVVVVGVNDLLRLRGLRAWRRDIQDLVATIRHQVGPEAPIAFCGIPPVNRFPALPQPLRLALALRAHLMDRVLHQTAFRCGAFTVALPGKTVGTESRTFFAHDRFHPSARGYTAVADAFLPAVLDRMRTS